MGISGLIGAGFVEGTRDFREEQRLQREQQLRELAAKLDEEMRRQQLALQQQQLDMQLEDRISDRQYRAGQLARQDAEALHPKLSPGPLTAEQAQTLLGSPTTAPLVRKLTQLYARPMHPGFGSMAEPTTYYQLEPTSKQAQDAYRETRKGELANVFRRGEKSEQQQAEIDAFKLGIDIEALKPAPPIQYTYTHPITGQQSVRFIEKDKIPASGIDLGRQPTAPRQGNFVTLTHPDTGEQERVEDGPTANALLKQGWRLFDPVKERQKEANDEAQEQARKAMQDYGDEMVDVINKLIDADGNLNPGVGAVIGGFEGGIPAFMQGEGGQAALGAIDRLLSMLSIETLGNLKAQSRTGATGFGALSEGELNLIGASGSTLKRRRQSEAAYGAELKRLRDRILNSESRRGGGGKRPPSPMEDAADALIREALGPKGKP